MRWIVRALGALLVAVLVAYVAFHLGSVTGRQSMAVDTSAGSSAHKAHSPAQVAATASATDWEAAADDFVAAFLDHSSNRKVLLRAVTSPRLATLLTRTDPAKIPTGRPVGEPSVVTESAESVTATQQVSDGTAIAFDLVPDPTASDGWIVTSVRPGTR